jgi:hypothetical protein
MDEWDVPYLEMVVSSSNAYFAMGRMDHNQKEGKYIPITVSRPFYCVLSMILDMIGVTLDIWYYPVKIFPILPQSEPFIFL